MPEDAHYRLAVALALGATALRAREELGVIGASWKVERRASHALAQELKSIRASANTRLVAILGALCAVAAVTKPSEKSFDAFREKLLKMFQIYRTATLYWIFLGEKIPVTN